MYKTKNIHLSLSTIHKVIHIGKSRFFRKNRLMHRVIHFIHNVVHNQYPPDYQGFTGVFLLPFGK